MGYQRYRWMVALFIFHLVTISTWNNISIAQEPIPLPRTAEALRVRGGSTTTFLDVADPRVPIDNTESGVSYVCYQGSSVPNGLGGMSQVKIGYDAGFVLASEKQLDLKEEETPFLIRVNGWAQFRHLAFESEGANPDQNQFQLTRARLVFSGNVFTPDLDYFVQLDGRSSNGDDARFLDYFMTYDFGHHSLGYEKRILGVKAGKYKIPFSLARYISGRQLEFSDRSMASIYFDANRSLACGLYGTLHGLVIPWQWETAILNGLDTGTVETGSSGGLDDNFAYAARLMAFPLGDWGTSELADFEWHDELATRIGAAWADSIINRSGLNEFDSIRVVDTGQELSSILPLGVDQYTVNLFSINHSCKWRGWSQTLEYYFRYINDFEGAAIPNLFDHGFWFQLGKFVLPEKLELLARWSRVEGNSGTLGVANESSEEIAGGFAWYFHKQNAKLTSDVTYLNGAPINSATLGISPGDIGWLFRTQFQFAF